MTTLDYSILVLYIAAVMCVGAFFFGKQKSLTEYFLGHRNIPWWAAACSGIATVMSAVSFLGAPGQAFKSDLRFLQYRLGTPFALFIIGWIMIPFFYRLRLFSIYEYLEKRFDLRTRLLASAQFLLLKALFLGIAIYAPSLIFVQMTGFPLVWIVVFTGLFITVYTTFGGVKAVIWTDTLQLAILFGGLFTAAAVVARRAGGVSAVWSLAEANHKLRFFDFSLDATSEFTVLGGILGGTFVLLAQYGVNQAELQKVLTTSSIPRCRLALFSSMVVSMFVGFLYFLIGAALWVFYSQNPLKGAAGLNPDRIFPKFIIEELPAGIKGLLMAAVASAAMSAVSSILNSLTTVATSDLYGRLSGRKPGVGTARWITVGIGVACTCAALYVDRLGNMLVAATRLQNVFGGSLTGVFLFGMTCKRANKTGAFYGVLAGTSGVLLVSAMTNISWLWHGLIAAGLAYGSGYALSLTSAAPDAEVQERLVWRP
jgi:solute:Na+ symporter, SSS family